MPQQLHLLHESANELPWLTVEELQQWRFIEAANFFFEGDNNFRIHVHMNHMKGIWIWIWIWIWNSASMPFALADMQFELEKQIVSGDAWETMNAVFPEDWLTTIIQREAPRLKRLVAGVT